MLDLSGNKHLKKVPSVVGKINTLNELNLSWCGLEDLPERLVQVYIIYKHRIYWGFYYYSSVLSKDSASFISSSKAFLLVVGVWGRQRVGWPPFDVVTCSQPFWLVVAGSTHFPLSSCITIPLKASLLSTFPTNFFFLLLGAVVPWNFFNPSPSTVRRRSACGNTSISESFVWATCT